MCNDLTEAERAFPLGLAKEDTFPHYFEVSGICGGWGKKEKDRKSSVLAIVDMEVRELFQVSLLVFSRSETMSLCFFTMYTKLAGPRPPGDSPADGPHLIKEHWDYR